MRVESGRIIQNPFKVVTTPPRCDCCREPIGEAYVAHQVWYRQDRFDNPPEGPFRFIYCKVCVEAMRTLEDGADEAAANELHVAPGAARQLRRLEAAVLHDAAHQAHLRWRGAFEHDRCGRLALAALVEEFFP